MSSAYMELADAYLNLGRYTQAIDSIEESRALKSDERGTAREAGVILTLADCYVRAGEHNKARKRLDDARTLAKSSMDRRTLGRATFVEAGLQDRPDRERDLLIHCLEDFLDPSETRSPMLFETQRLAIQRLRSIGSLSDPQRRTIDRMRAPRAFSPCVSSLLNFDFFPLPGRPPRVAAVWQL